MTEEQKMYVWIPLLVLWVVTLVVRAVPSIADRLQPAQRRYATIVGWIAALGIIVVLVLF